jgi:hypothetical protein
MGPARGRPLGEGLACREGVALTDLLRLPVSALDRTAKGGRNDRVHPRAEPLSLSLLRGGEVLDSGGAISGPTGPVRVAA